MSFYHGNHIFYAFTLSFLSISIVLLSIVLIFLCRKKQFKPNKEFETTTIIKPSATNYPLSEIDSATDRFNTSRIIGKGRLGTTYAAVLDKDELVVAKRIYPWLVLSKAGLGFQSMIKSLSLAQHPNIVPIVGFSEAPGERIILMEYVDTMSLDFYLHQHVDGPSLLGWIQRLKIAAGIARGVEYLHEKMAPQVVHGCIKPSNVLVDVEFCPKLCDYGLSFLASKNEKMGLLGYVDEEYWLEGKSGGACKESDVYGIGVVLLELLTGKRNEGGLLVGWVFPLIKEMRYSEFLDPRIDIPSNMKPIVRLGKVALACVGNSRKTRPKISQIVSILDSLDDFDLRD
ncbi:phytosulfokine receptor 1-like [Chenopodium quinoa]|uniref:phytosulfokine receptor 1-like n=1 Tax=Chenopodium quinoa TaxID=63459 RepID=UPI000B799B82|nr:phytosulfokine receptor 1-like [Chenopodium quinoa]